MKPVTKRRPMKRPERKPKHQDHYPFGIFNILNLLGGGHANPKR